MGTSFRFNAETSLERSSSSSETFSREVDGGVGWAFPGLLLAWSLLLKHLAVPWRVSPHYHFGWMVPFLALYFLLSRWNRSGRGTPSDNRGAMAAAIAFAFLLLPVWWIRVATPDWSVIGYTLAALVTSYTFFIFAWQGGWRFTAHLAFAIFLIFCAVPWPQRAETWLTQSLSRWVAGCTVEMLQWAGIAAERAGNVVALPGGLIEVSDACSGVRSLQSMLMAGLCLGEVHRFSAPRRLLLVTIGLAIALILNVVRNFGLSLLANSEGMGAIAKWHDSAGWSIFLISFCLLALVARGLTARGHPTAAESTGYYSPSLRRFPRWAGAAFAIWFLTIFAGTEVWYRAHEQRGLPTPRLSFHWPESGIGYRREPIPDTALNLLMASEVRAASWEESPGHRWTMTTARWAPGETATQSARMHFPEVCLPALGSQFIRTYPSTVLPIRDGELLFRVSEFLNRGRRVFILFCLHEESDRDQSRSDLLQEWSPWSRIQRAAAGYRNRGQQSIALVITGAVDATDALHQAALRLPDFVALETGR
jgi:exosortase